MKAATGKRAVLHLVAALALLLCALGTGSGSVHAATQRFFPETGKTVNDPFLSYWTAHGGLSQQGFPVTDAINEKNDADGKIYETQYFERARFEYHPESTDPKFKVLLGLLGKEALAAKYGGNPPDTDTQTVPGGGSKTFLETGKTVTGLFLNYWNTHGGLEQQGYPITNAYEEVNDDDGQTYITQYFERARFEYHPENADPKFKVLLGLVGREIYGLKQGSGITGGTGGGTTNPTATATPTATPIATPPTTPENSLSIPGWTHIAVTTNNIVFFYNKTNGHGATARLNPDGSLTVLQKFPDPATGHAAFDPGIGIITAGPYKYLVMYPPSGFTSVCYMGDDGIIGSCNHFTFEKYWTNISIDRVTGMAWLYSSTDGVRNIAKLNPGGADPGGIGTYSSVTNYIKAPRQTYPIGNGMWLDFDYGTNTGATLSVDKDTGEVKRLQGVADLGTKWSMIASNQSSIGFYGANAYTSLIASTAADGNIVPLKNYAAPATITIIATALNGPYLNYSISTGELSVVEVAADGGATNLQQYAPTK